MRRAEEARKAREAIEKVKRDLNNRACTSLVNGQKYAQELAAIYQKEHEAEKIQKFLNTNNPATMSIVVNNDILSLLTQDQKIDMILLSNEKNKIESPLTSDYIGLTKNDLRGQGISVADGSTDAMLTFYNFMYKTSKFGITLSDAEYNAQAKKRAELEASMFAMLMASNLTGNMNNPTKEAQPPVTKPNTSKSVSGGTGNNSKIFDSASVVKKGGETVAGHALQKHAGRNPDIWGKVSGNSTKINNTAMQHIDDIVNGSGNFKTVQSNSISFLEKMLPDGRGIRLNMDGTFKGFIDQVR